MRVPADFARGKRWDDAGLVRTREGHARGSSFEEGHLARLRGRGEGQGLPATHDLGVNRVPLTLINRITSAK